MQRNAGIDKQRSQILVHSVFFSPDFTCTFVYTASVQQFQSTWQREEVTAVGTSMGFSTAYTRLSPFLRALFVWMNIRSSTSHLLKSENTHQPEIGLAIGHLLG
jgi:hypothetical protein